jgi:hypothetical protein
LRHVPSGNYRNRKGDFYADMMSTGQGMTNSKTGSMNPPRKHHFVPSYYLKQWNGADSQLCEYKLVRPGKVVSKSTPSTATGFERDLYKIEGMLIVRMINLKVVAQAREFVWGFDDSQLSFVSEWIGKMPVPPLLTPEQKEASIAAARK